jgi:hypothetical protein
MQSELTDTAQRLGEIQARVDDKKALHASLSQQRHALEHRISAAARSLRLLSDTLHDFRKSLHHQSEVPYGLPQHSGPFQLPCASTEALLGLSDLGGPYTAKGNRAARGAMLPRHRCPFSGLYEALPAVQRPLASFRAHACVSIADMRSHAQHAIGCRGQCEQFLQAVRDVKRGKAQALRLHMQEVCWHVQSAFEVAPGACLSFTSSLSTPECILSLHLVYIGTLFEMALLGVQQGYCTPSQANHATGALSPLQTPPAHASSPTHTHPARHVAPAACNVPPHATSAAHAHLCRPSVTLHEPTQSGRRSTHRRRRWMAAWVPVAGHLVARAAVAGACRRSCAPPHASPRRR